MHQSAVKDTKQVRLCRQNTESSQQVKPALRMHRKIQFDTELKPMQKSNFWDSSFRFPMPCKANASRPTDYLIKYHVS